eukprot:5156034-Pleurochrysis_carterae.AAC.3
MNWLQLNLRQWPTDLVRYAQLTFSTRSQVEIRSWRGRWLIHQGLRDARSWICKLTYEACAELSPEEHAHRHAKIELTTQCHWLKTMNAARDDKQRQDVLPCCYSFVSFGLTMAKHALS